MTRQNDERGFAMTKTLKVALAGAGAFGLRHLDAIKEIDGVETISLIGRELDKTEEAAAKYGVGHATTDLADANARRAGAAVSQGQQACADRDSAC
jgi:2-hydroxy-4-carboxymuconate semialdehyde hemiacetal dehydrogenase